MQTSRPLEFIKSALELLVTILVPLVFLLWMAFAAACSPRKIHYPASVIDRCPFEHIEIPEGPLTQETVDNIINNHDLDHQCINYLKNLLKPFIEKYNLHFKTIPYTLPSVTPRDHYLVYYFIFPEQLAEIIAPVIAHWNGSLGRNFIEVTDDPLSANIYIMFNPAMPVGAIGIALTASNLPCTLMVNPDITNITVGLEVASHEIGHCLGLDHREDGGLMEPAKLQGSATPDPTSIKILRLFNPYLGGER